MIRKAAWFVAAAGLAGAATVPHALQVVTDATLVGSANPAGVQAELSGSLRLPFSGSDPEAPDSYLQAGLATQATPAYAGAGVFGEWQPAPWLSLHVQESRFHYFGASGALLSFSGPGAGYGTADLDRLKGQEEAGSSNQFQCQPTLQAQVGPVVFRDEATVTWFRFQGRGPWFYEPDNDLLLHRSDRVQDNVAQVLLESRTDSGLVYAGPSYQTTRSREAGLCRRRLGLAGSWLAESDWGMAGRPNAFAFAGRDLKDPNRTGQIYVALGIGTTWVR